MSRIDGDCGFDVIICIGGEDWWYHNRGHFDFQIMRRLAERWPVLFVNSLGVRMPSLKDNKLFVERIGRKLKSLARGVVNVENRFWVFSPVMVPGERGQRLSNWALAPQIRMTAARAGIRKPLLWVHCPAGAALVGEMDAAAVVMQRTDRFGAFPGADPPAFLRVAKQSISLQNQDSKSIVTVITDLSELKENERRLKYSESLYRQIARNVPNSAIYVFDKKLVYHLAEGSLVGSISLPKDQIEGRHVLDTGEDMEVLKERAIRYQKVVEGHSDQMQIDEFGRSYLVNTTPIRNEQNEIIFGLVDMILDVTELKKAQLELEEKNDKLTHSNDELEKFAYVASHDLQSPLKTIISFLQLLEQRHGSALGDEGKEFINFCISSSTRMRNLIADLLDYSRVNSISRPFVEANLSELMFVVTKNLESNINAKNAQIEFENLPTIMAEPYMLTQLLQNLVDNAMQFTKPDQAIKINVRYCQTATHHQISVEDNGIGIKKSFKKKYFRFFNDCTMIPNIVVLVSV